MSTRFVQIDDLTLHVLESNKGDAPWYSQRKVYEERRSFLYKLLQREGFKTFVDVGANYGFISMLARLHLPSALILSIEADPRLANLIEQNFSVNNLDSPEVLNIIAADAAIDSTTFCLNPNSSLDNRVAFAGWQQVEVKSRSLGTLLSERQLEGPVFIKVDTQGYEPKVLRGLESWLGLRSDWFIKMEFAPKWLESQQHSPLELLEYLSERYDFVEYPERIRFNTVSLESLFDKKISRGQLVDFLSYVTSLNRDGLGWVDLLVRPKRV